MGLSNFISRVFGDSADADRAIDRLAVETGRRVAHQYLDCYRNLEQSTNWFANLSNEERYIHVLRYIDGKELYENLNLKHEPIGGFTNAGSDGFARLKIETAKNFSKDADLPFDFTHVILVAAIETFVRENPINHDYRVSPERMILIGSGILKVIPENL